MLQTAFKMYTDTAKNAACHHRNTKTNKKPDDTKTKKTKTKTARVA